MPIQPKGRDKEEDEDEEESEGSTFKAALMGPAVVKKERGKVNGGGARAAHERLQGALGGQGEERLGSGAKAEGEGVGALEERGQQRRRGKEPLSGSKIPERLLPAAKIVAKGKGGRSSRRRKSNRERPFCHGRR